MTVRGTLNKCCVTGNSGDYMISNPQNIPENVEYYFELYYYGYFQGNTW